MVNNIFKAGTIFLLALSACNVPEFVSKTPMQSAPERYPVEGNTPDTSVEGGGTGEPRLTGNPGRVGDAGSFPDTVSAAGLSWRSYFTDPDLLTLIDTALARNQELQITLQEIEIARNEVRARKGEYLPFVHARAGAGVEKVGRYTPRGASEATTDIKPGMEMPEPVPDYMGGLYASWEVDIWRKLRNAKAAAAARYLASVEGKNFVVTHLVAEVAEAYYELLALDNELAIVRQNIALQSNALSIVKLQKEATRVTELAVRKFEAELMHTRSLEYDILQKITETENRINLLLGRYPQPIPRSPQRLDSLVPSAVHTGIPAQLLANRPDIRQAERELAAAKLDVRVARARFYPALGINAGIGYQAFDPVDLIKTPESLLFSVAGDLAAPLVNRNAIKAAYRAAGAKQLQALYRYNQTVLNAYLEVVNQMTRIGNLEKSYLLRQAQVKALSQSIDISAKLFNSARADYMEVLMTQRDVLEAKFELVETRARQLKAAVHIYQALGGGWR
jgi:multidrug efflux system outer membrane protein